MALKLSTNASRVLEERYLTRDEEGNIIENPEQMFRRVARSISSADSLYGHTSDEIKLLEDKFFQMMVNLEFLPNSPTLMNAGHDLQQLSACFVLPVEDSTESIFDAVKYTALVHKSGGGTGFSFSRLRPKNDRVRSTGGVASGAVSFMKVFNVSTDVIKQGGCLVPDTLVFTSNGLLRLDELVDNHKAGWQEHSLKVATDEGDKRSPRGYNNGVVPVLTVSTDRGITLTGTPNHKVKVMTDEGAVWRQLSNLQSGDAILVKLGQHKGRVQELQHPEIYHHNQKPIQLPKILDKSFAFILGLLNGDGFIASGSKDYRIGFSVSHDSYLIEELPDLLQKLFPGIHIQRMQKDNDASVTFVVSSRLLKEFFEVNNLSKKTSHNASIPLLIRQSPPSVVGAYLRGLFEADGTLNHGYPALISISNQLIQEVSALLIGLGCPISIRELPARNDRFGSNSLWEIRLRSYVALEVWRDKIGSDSRSRFATCYEFKPDLKREKSYVLPGAKWWITPVLTTITLPQRDNRGRGMDKNFTSTEPKLRKKLLRYLHGRRQFTLSAYHNLSEEHPEFASNAPDVDNIWFIKVNEVQEAGKSQTMDLEVDENHTYLAHGVVTHNTRRGANMAILRVDNPDIFEFITCKEDETAYTNFNISVAITETFMHALQADSDYDLLNPRTNETVERVSAKQVWDLLIEMAWKNGEPGVVFLDRINEANPTPHLGDIEATNPCVTGDTWVTTDAGPAMIRDILGVPTRLLLDGTFHAAANRGFFSTGVKDVYEIRTNRGYHIKATANHLIRVATDISRDGIKANWKPVSDLKPGDKLVLSNNRGTQWDGSGSYDEGYLLGMLLGDGTLMKETAIISVWGEGNGSQSICNEVERFAHPMPHRSDFKGFFEIKGRGEYRLKSKVLQQLALKYSMTPGDKTLTPEIEATNVEFHKGFLSGLFDADGSVQGTNEKGWSVRMFQSNMDTLKAVQRMLHRFGIASTIYENRRSEGSRLLPDEKWGYRYYTTTAQHELVISRDNIMIFAKTIGFANSEKQQKLLEALSALSRGPYRERFLAEVSQIIPLGREEVFDVQIPGKNTFSANGLYVHNCGEQPLLPYESCNLGSINLSKMVYMNVYGEPAVNYFKLREVVRLAVHFLDNVIDVNKYPLPEIEEITKGNRKIGLGIMGFADMLIKIQVPYDSPRALEVAEEVMSFISQEAKIRSQEIAHERGPFPNFRGSVYDKPGHPLMRNATLTTIAPTGTLSIIAGCSSGIEPLFAVAFVRNILDNKLLPEINSVFKEIARREGFYNDKLVQQIIDSRGAIKGIPEIPSQIRQLFVTAHEIYPQQHIRMQAIFQNYTDNAVSKTVNFSKNASKSDVEEVYRLSYELGCKGVTVYRDGSRGGQVLSTEWQT